MKWIIGKAEVSEIEYIKVLLNDGWEPFAVVGNTFSHASLQQQITTTIVIYFRKEV